MANGDAAAAAGLPVVPPTADLRQGYDNINQLADRLAAHMVSGGHAYDKITGTPATFPSDWDTTVDKPATFPSDWATLAGRPVGGVKTLTTDGNGAAVFEHGLGRTPAWAHVTLGGVPMGTQTDAMALFGDLVLWRITTVELEVRLKRTDLNVWFPGQAIAFTWSAG